VVTANPTGRTSAKWKNYEPDVLPLWVAEMDFPLAPVIARALHDAVDRSDTGYRWADGLPQALTGFAHRRMDWKLDPERVIVLGDVLAAMSESMHRLTPEGSSIVITPPVYPPFFSTVRRVIERPLVEVPLRNGHELDLDGLAQAFARPDVSAFLMSSPHNPTGTIHSRATLEQVALLAREHGVVVIADEVWAPLPLDGREVTPYLALGEDLTGPDVSLIAASKAFNLAGLKCAQIIGGSAQTAATLREGIPVEVTYAAGQFGVIASIAAYSHGDEWLDDTLAMISNNARLLADLLATHLPAVKYTPPQASYLAWLDCRALGLGDEPARIFREGGRVALNEGAEFGEQGRGFVRLNLATTPEVVEEAVVRMASVLHA